MAVTYGMTDSHWTITRSTGAIVYTGDDHGVGNESYATTIEFHRWLQKWADDASSSGSDDQSDITDPDSSVRTTDNIITLKNGYFITDTEAQHLYDGSITQGDVGVDQKIWDGVLNYGNADVQIQIHQDGAIITDDFWNQAGVGLNPDASQGISHRFMVLVHDFAGDGGDIDGRRLLGTCRRFGYTYNEFPINGSVRGNNVLALGDATDLNNATIEATVSGWGTIANLTEGYNAIDVDNNGADEYYYSEWNKDTYSINQFYERMKWLTREASVSTIYGLNGELFRGITHYIAVDGITSGPLSAVEELTWTESGTVSSGQMLAVDSVAAPGKVWIQLLKGIVPTDGTVLTGGTSGATVTVNVTVTAKTVSKPFCGASTGTTLVGAFGFSLEYDDLGKDDKMFDLDDGGPNSPPNLQQFTVLGLSATFDRLLVATNDAGDIEYGQFTVDGAHGVDSATITILEDIPTDTPSANGTIRAFDGTDYVRITYTSWSGKIFSGCGSHPALSSAADLFISYIDKLAGATSEAVTLQYAAADRTMFVRVRSSTSSPPIKTAETTGLFTTAGGSATINRISDA